MNEAAEAEPGESGGEGDRMRGAEAVAAPWLPMRGALMPDVPPPLTIVVVERAPPGPWRSRVTVFL